MSGHIDAETLHRDGFGINKTLPQIIGSVSSGILARPITEVKGNTPTPSYYADVHVARYIAPPPGISRDMRGFFIALLMVQAFPNLQTRDMGDLILTLIEWAYPGIMRRLMNENMGFKLKRIELPIDIFNALKDGEDVAFVGPVRPETPTTTETGIPQVETRVRRDLGEVKNTFIENLEADVDLYTRATLDEALYFIIIILYIIGKDPNGQNIRAFQHNRLEAYRNVTGIKATEDTILDPSNMPQVDALRAAKGWYNLNPRFRKVMVREVVRWSDSPTSDDQEIMLMITSLWRNTGMNHIWLIKDLVNDYRLVLAQIPGLRTEVERFTMEYRHWQQQPKDYLSPYVKVIEGSRATTINSRDYPDLLRLARWVAAMKDPRMTRYASSSGRSFFIDEFIAKAGLLGITVATDLVEPTE